MKNIKTQEVPDIKKADKLSRREAMTRVGLSAFSVATMMFLLNKPEKAQAQDTSLAPDDPDTW